MTANAWFGIAVVLLLAALAAAFARWPRAGLSDPVMKSRVGRFVLVATTVGGLMGVPFWWLDLPPSFAWDLPPLASRLLAVAALAFGLTGVFVLERPHPLRTRLYLILILVYLVPLAVVAVAAHLDRFDFLKPVTYGFFGVVIILSSGAALELLRGRRVVSDAVLPNQAIHAWLAAFGATMMLWGFALFVAPSTDFPPLFLWRDDALTSRLIAAMLLTIGTAALLSARDMSLARLALCFGGVYGIGVLAAFFVNAVAGKPVAVLYVVIIGGGGLISLGFLAVRGERTDSWTPGTNT